MFRLRGRLHGGFDMKVIPERFPDAAVFLRPGSSQIQGVAFKTNTQDKIEIDFIYIYHVKFFFFTMIYYEIHPRSLIIISFLPSEALIS